MREQEAILAAYDDLKASGTKCILVTLVHVNGSSYRQAGARMLISETGYMVGSISGGCLEGDALKKALFALHQGQNKLVTYDTSDEEDAVIGAQLGCNGIIQVLFEPVFYDYPHNPVELLRKVALQEKKMALITRFNLEKNQEQRGTTLVFDPDLQMTGTETDSALLSALKADTLQAFQTGQSLFIAYPTNHTTEYAFIEICSPPPELILIGAGNDAQILSQMALLLGWKVTIADGRPTHANLQRFGSSCQIIVSRPEKILERLNINERSFFALMTHNFQYDLAVLKLLLQYPEIPYIGVLGPKKKFQKMLEAMEEEGIHLHPEQMNRIFAPIGLHLGGENAAEIGASVIAEILAVWNQTSSGHLRDLEGPIHSKRNHEFRINTALHP